jgi:hypothetical protein
MIRNSSSKRWLSNITTNNKLWNNNQFGFYLFNNIITQTQATSLSYEAIKFLQYKPYEIDHYDHVIKNYREKQVGLGKWSIENRALLTKIQEIIQQTTQLDINKPFMDPHIIELKPSGRIDAHVDSVKYGGEVVAAISLQSKRRLIMTYPNTNQQQQQQHQQNIAFELDLEPCSLYIMSKQSRYELAHAITASTNNNIDEKNRISIVFRDVAEIPQWMKEIQQQQQQQQQQQNEQS